MTRVIISEDCSNSPKNIFAQNLTIAFAKNDAKFILGSVTDDICWNIIGENTIQGKDDLSKALERMDKNKAMELTINHVMTHGKAGAVNGTLKLKNGIMRAFCDVYEFSGAKGTNVKEITSYVIEIK
jgi:hypothetical protein